MKELDIILELIRDSNWHSIGEIKRETSLPSETLDKVLSFLHEQAFIDKENGELRITPTGQRLLELPD
ncbi:MAG: hypothetical protein OIN66_18050 [Candidatus Methanoperedens sp.]|nr:hypothetical protein [Candidatus Methanoperedens sp.]